MTAPRSIDAGVFMVPARLDLGIHRAFDGPCRVQVRWRSPRHSSPTRHPFDPARIHDGNGFAEPAGTVSPGRNTPELTCEQPRSAPRPLEGPASYSPVVADHESGFAGLGDSLVVEARDKAKTTSCRRGRVVAIAVATRLDRAGGVVGGRPALFAG